MTETGTSEALGGGRDDPQDTPGALFFFFSPAKETLFQGEDSAGRKQPMGDFIAYLCGLLQWPFSPLPICDALLKMSKTLNSQKT
jgi:hypothetical protein